jgi:hypothetical protein
MTSILRRAALLAALLLPLAATAGPRVEVEVFDRTSGRTLPVYWHDGEQHVAGEPGHEYEIRIRNRGYGRVLAVTSVDGVNVVTGRTASPGQSGYVIEPRESVDIDGWRKSLDEVAAFYFTSLPDSYAARTGRPDNVGVIGVALFREEISTISYFSQDGAAARSEEAPAAEKRAAAPSHHRDEDRLGTGHGERRGSAASYTTFERASEHPDEVIRIYYDSRRNLIARGVIPRPRDRHAWRHPEPFPQEFVPDP